MSEKRNPYESPRSIPDVRNSRLTWKRPVAFVAVVGLVVSLACYSFLIELLALIMLNSIASVIFFSLKERTKAKLAFCAFVGYLVTLVLTDWGFSMPNPEITIFWPTLTLAIVAQAGMIRVIGKNQRGGKIKGDAAH